MSIDRQIPIATRGADFGEASRRAPKIWQSLVVVAVLGLAALLGRTTSPYVLASLVALGLVLVLAREPRWGLLVLPIVAVLVPLQVGTGTDVSLNAAVFAVPAFTVIWLLQRLVSGHFSFVPSRLNRPLLAFLLVTVVSWTRGNAMWDLAVPRPDNAFLVQSAQVSIYVLSFLAFWMMANLATDLHWLRRITYAFVAPFGAAAIGLLVTERLFLVAIPFLGSVPQNLLMVWLTALSLATVRFDPHLTRVQRSLLIAVAASGVLAPFLLNRQWVGGWMPPFLTAAAVIWLGYPRLRPPAVAVVGLVLLLEGSAPFLRIINFDAEWDQSGGSRLVLWRAVIEMGNRSPLLGLGPVAYRYYHYVEPLVYKTAVWLRPDVAAHNMYIDLYGQLGLLGVASYLWFLIEAALVSWKLYRSLTGFARAYAVAVMSALAGTVAADMLAETSLPFIYNQGMPGFRVSVVAWMLLGGLVVLEQVHKTPQIREARGSPE